MTTFLVISSIALWVLVLFLAFLLLGALRALGQLSWRLEQVQAAMPQGRFARDGLKTGTRAPDFTLPAAAGGDVSLRDFAGREVLLVFVQGGCGPCRLVVPELNRRRDKREPAVLAIFNGDPEAARTWAAEVKADFPVLSQEKLAISKRYQMFATPFAFLIDDKGIIASKGIINNAQHVGYVLAGRSAGVKDEHAEPEGAEKAGADESGSSHALKEISHV